MCHLRFFGRHVLGVGIGGAQSLANKRLSAWKRKRRRRVAPGIAL